MPSHSKSSELLTVSEAAPLLGMKVGALRQHIHRGLVPVVRIGTAVRVPQAWIDSKVEEAMSAYTAHQN